MCFLVGLIGTLVCGLLRSLDVFDWPWVCVFVPVLIGMLIEGLVRGDDTAIDAVGDVIGGLFDGDDD